MFNRVLAKRSAKATIKGNLYVLGAMAALPMIVSIIGVFVTPELDLDLLINSDSYYATHMPNYLWIRFIILVLTATVTYFLIVACLQFQKNQEATWDDISGAFHISGFIKMLSINLIMDILVGFGILLFLIPGIYLSYRYFFAVYIIADDSDVGIIQAMKKSAVLSKGIKLDLFAVDLSFIPWLLAQMIVIAYVRFDLLALFVLPYMHLTKIYIYKDCLHIKEEAEKTVADIEF